MSESTGTQPELFGTNRNLSEPVNKGSGRDTGRLERAVLTPVGSPYPSTSAVVTFRPPSSSTSSGCSPDDVPSQMELTLEDLYREIDLTMDWHGDVPESDSPQADVALGRYGGTAPHDGSDQASQALRYVFAADKESEPALEDIVGHAAAPTPMPPLRLEDLLAAVKSTRLEEVPVVVASLLRRYCVARGEETLMTVLRAMHVARRDIMSQLRRDVTRVRLQGFTDAEVVNYVLRYLDYETGEPPEASF